MAAELLVHMASLGAFSGRADSGFYVSPEKEATELEFLLKHNYVAQML
jgi:hypothetical protein